MTLKFRERIVPVIPNNRRSDEESILLKAITYIAGVLYFYGSLILVFYIASWLGLGDSNISRADYFKSTSAIYMLVLVTVFALIKDIMFNNISTAPIYTSSRSRDSAGSDFLKKRTHPENPTILGLLCTLLLSVSLITLHTKGALVKIVGAVSSTDFLTTADIVHNTIGSILDEIISVETVPSNYRQIIRAEGEGVLRDSHFIKFCGNPKNIFQSARNNTYNESMYLKYTNGTLRVYQGRLHHKTMGFPSKYLYYLSTILIPIDVESKTGGLLVWSTRVDHVNKGIYYKMEQSSKVMRLFTFKLRKYQESHRAENIDLIPFKTFFMCVSGV